MRFYAFYVRLIVFKNNVHIGIKNSIIRVVFFLSLRKHQLVNVSKFVGQQTYLDVKQHETYADVLYMSFIIHSDVAHENKTPEHCIFID